ncbi:MAG TPA: GntR family transcriptional regulator [Armatimonadota bacterium]|nr:GntR family transcriptional regulator [Armatimonadota bacterium]
MSTSERRVKYREIYEVLRKRIRTGEYRPGEQIPSLNQLCTAFNVSQITVRQAISALVNEGLLDRVQGKGNFVTSTPATPVTIALIFPHLYTDLETHPTAIFDRLYSIPLIGAIEQSTREQQVNLVLWIDDDDLATERAHLQRALNRQVDAAIVFYIGEYQNLDILNELRISGVPLVLIDRYPAGWTGNYVVTDSFAGAHQAVETLMHHGFTRIYFLAPQEQNSSTLSRIDGVIAQLRGRSVYTDDLIKVLASWTSTEVNQEACAVTHEIITREPGRFALFASNMQIFSGACKALQERYIDMSQVGLACFDTPPINMPADTTFIRVTQPLEQMGRESVRIVMEALAGRTESQQCALPPTVQLASNHGFISLLDDMAFSRPSPAKS